MPKAVAMKSTRNIDEFMIEDQRTRKKYDYMFQRARNNDMLRNNNNNGPVYDMESYDLDSNPEEFSNLMMDYVNMKKNDVILLDDSTETRTRKRGNVKRQNIPDPPCSCTYTNKTKDFGENAFPRFVEIRNCSELQQQSCLLPYVCKETLYNINILKRRQTTTQHSEKVPNELKYRWIAEKWQVSVGCVCTRDYRDTISQE